MRWLKLLLSYDGTNYVGWQLQPNGPSIQGALENAWNSLTGEALRMTSCGRTDSGVHAIGQVVSLATQSDLDSGTIQRALNAILPGDISILSVTEMPEGFHAIRDCVRKTYRYQIQAGRLCDVFVRNFAWHVPVALEVSWMRAAAASLVGRHDFVAFQAAGSERYSTIRNVQSVSVHEQQDRAYQRVNIEITADGFLYNMVRCIAGSLVLVGQGKRPVEWLGSALKSRDRAQAGPTAPAHGLILVSAEHQLSGRNQGDGE